jgi:hypothetical protein
MVTKKKKVRSNGKFGITALKLANETVLRRRRPAWQQHELATKAIFEALLKQDNAQNLEVKHNETIKGTVTDHQVDISWQFRMGGESYAAIVQVKKQKGRANKGDLLLFHCVLSDIPGQPKGIFVTESGYQKGALEVAKAAGITVYEIKEMSRDNLSQAIQITGYSVVIVRQNPDKVAWEQAVFIPTLGDVRMSLDETWMAQHPESLPADMGTVPAPNLYDVHFIDGAGNVRASIATLIQDRIMEFGQAGQTILEVEFPDPTYVVGLNRSNKDGNLVGDVKIARLSVPLDIKLTTNCLPQFSQTAATYLFKKAMETDHRCVLVAENGSGMAAQLSVPQAILRIGWEHESQ